jgi:hypothetical protein
MKLTLEQLEAHPWGAAGERSIAFIKSRLREPASVAAVSCSE